MVPNLNLFTKSILKYLFIYLTQYMWLNELTYSIVSNVFDQIETFKT